MRMGLWRSASGRIFVATGFSVGLLLLLGACTLNLTKGRYDEGQIPHTGEGGPLAQSVLESEKGLEPPEPDIFPSLTAPDLLILVLRCEPKGEDSEKHEPLIRNASLAEYLSSIKGLSGALRDEVIDSSAVVVSRILPLEVKGEARDVPLSYLVPMRMFMMLAPSGEVAPVAHLLYQVGMPMPTELFSFYLEQSMVPQFDSPEVFAKNKAVLLDYFKFSKALQAHLLKEQKSEEDLGTSLGIQGLKPDDIDLVMKHERSDDKLDDVPMLAVMFISPDECRYQTPMSAWLPAFGGLAGRVTLKPGDIIDRLWGNINIWWLVIKLYFICPTPSPSPEISYGFPGGIGGGKGGVSDDWVKDPCNPQNANKVGE